MKNILDNDNIDDKLNQLIFDFHIDCKNPGFRRKYRSVELMKTFREEYIDSKNTLIVGNCMADINAFFDDMGFSEEPSFLVFESEEWESADIAYLKTFDHIVIVSYYRRGEIKTTLLREGICALSLYAYFEKNEHFTLGNYYEVYVEAHTDYNTGEGKFDYMHVDTHEIFFNDRIGYERSLDRDEKQSYLQKMIFNCVYARDFIALKSCVSQYCQEKFAHYENYSLFFKKVEELLECIKSTIAKRTQKDIILYWLDQMKCSEVEEMPFFQSLSERGISFSHAYTCTPYTNPSGRLILTGKREIEDKAFHITQLDANNSIVIRTLQEQGYSFNYIGSILRMDRCLTRKKSYSRYTPVSTYLWDLYQILLVEKKPVFIIVHELAETHNFNLSFGLSGEKYCKVKKRKTMIPGDDKQLQLQRKTSINYCSKQLFFSSFFISKKTICIYMTDHGKNSGESFNEKFHTFLKIVGDEVPSMKINTLFSYEDFPQLVEYITKGEFQKIRNNLKRDFVQIQDVDCYSAHIILEILNKKDFYSRGLVGYQGAINKDYFYVEYKDGTKIFGNNGNKKRISKNDIELMKRFVSKKSIDIYAEEKFKYSRCVYEVMNRYQERKSHYEIRLKKAMVGLFQNLSKDGTLALRGGGIHSVELWNLLDWDERDKINYVVDYDSNCCMKQFGVPIISEENLERKKVNIVLISSFSYEQAWMCQLRAHYPKIEVIGLYEYLRTCGFELEREFYLSQYEDEDFFVSIPQ